jgi:hypothetical protein
MAAHATGIEYSLRELLCANADRVEGIGEVGAVLQPILISLHKFLTSLILAVVVAASRLYRDDEVIVVVLVDEDHVVGLALEHAIDELLLHEVVPWLADIDLSDQPSIFAENARNDLIEVLGMSSIGVAHEGCIIVEYDSLALEILVVVAEVLSEFRKLALILHVEGFEDAKLLV